LEVFMLARRPPRPARPGLASLARALAAIALLPIAFGCSSPGSDGSGTAGTSGGTAGTSGGTAGTSGAAGRGGTTGTAGTSGVGGSAGGTSGAAGRGGTTGTAGSTAGSSGGTSATAGTGGGAGTGGSGGSGGTTGAAGSSGGRGGTTGTAGTGGSGTGGTGTGGSGTGGTTVASTCGAGPPSAPAGGASFPFPQHRASSTCIYPPTCSDADMMAGWTAFKTALVVADGTDGSMRVQRDSGNGNDTVSEGIAYGMLFSVYMNDKTTFDAIWKYEQKHLDIKGLMNWHINSNGTTAGGGQNSATDADEDMAFALVMADKQWGGYMTTATSMLTTVSMNDFATDGTIKGGDQYANAVNPSYLAPAFYRVFAAYSGDARWTTILDKSYSLLSAAQNATSGLVPDWSMGPAANTSYGYDATRTPFRVALDACWSGDPRAQMFSQKIGAFFAGIGAANIVDGYSVTGTKTGSNHNATFVGPAGAAGMASDQATLVADAYTFVSAAAKAANTNYFDRSWALFTVMLMTGNFVNFQAP
jgi:endo-1,4-beta-D-glucanase Y